jgi:phosphorylase kinase alpha/beta subunit
MPYGETLEIESYPLKAGDFLTEPTALHETLEARGVLQFRAYKSGLFPASDLPPETGEATGMDMAWLRDNAHVINALYETGHHDLAAAGGRAILTILQNNREILDGVADDSAPDRRLPVRVKGDTLQNDTEPRVQNDSTGYALRITSKLIRRSLLQASDQELGTLAQTARYLEKIKFWEAEDEGHWEEDRRVHGSSIGVVVGGLREAQAMFSEKNYAHDIDFDDLRRRGESALYAILDQGRSDLGSDASSEEERLYPSTIEPHELVRQHFDRFSVSNRKYDAALLCLTEPMDVLDDSHKEKVVQDIIQNLQRKNGFARYDSGDTYWEPRFPSIMSIEERTKLSQGSTDRRNQTAAGVAFTETEAQWTLFDPLLSAYWGKRYAATGDETEREKQLFYLNRSLAQMVTTPTGELQLPEAYYLEYLEETPTRPAGNYWIANPHTPLLWSQANLLLALKVFEATTSHAGS